MKKKFLVIAAVFMLMFSFAGQAMAAFATGDLIRVVYVTGGVGNEVATDLGAATTWTPGTITSTTSFTADKFSLSSFTGYGYSDLKVVYFLDTTAGGNYWTSGDPGGQTTTSGKKTTLATATASVLSYYAGLGGSQVTGLSSNLSSYWKKLDQSGTQTGKFMGFLTTSGEVSLAALATVGYVDQWLYYYSSPNSAASGNAVAKLRTFADGHTEVSAVPVPAAIWLLGSGLIGLVGIRRRMTA